MAYLVKLTARAERDLVHIYNEINAADSDAALKWYRGLKDAILSLEEQPDRCPVTPENAKPRSETEVQGVRRRVTGRVLRKECL
jgi:plasmid stabilization system protein ParE